MGALALAHQVVDVQYPQAEQHELAAAIQAPDTVPALTGAITRLLQQGLVRPAAPAGA